MLLHGDLQHYNVLFDNERGWVAIDPKGVVGEWEYEVGPLLRNPVEQPELFANPAIINRRLELLTTLLPLNHLPATEPLVLSGVLHCRTESIPSGIPSKSLAGGR